MNLRTRAGVLALEMNFACKSLILNNLRILQRCFFYKRCLFFAKNETYFTISFPNTLYLVIVIT